MTTDPTTPAHSDGRPLGILIAVASILSILMMAHHPSIGSHEMADVAAEIARKATIDRVVHGSLIALVGVLLYGLAEFSIRLKSQALARAALLAFALGICAEIGAALISGFVIADLGTSYAGGPQADLDAMRHLLFLAFRANQALANFGVVAMSVGIALWSVALLRQRANGAVAIFGVALGVAGTLAMVFGMLRLNVHGMLLVIVADALWYLAVSMLLITRKL